MQSVYLLVVCLSIGMTFGMSQAYSITLGLWIARFVGLSIFLALTGAFFTLTYSPLKTLIEGSPKKLWSGAFPLYYLYERKSRLVKKIR